MERWKRLQKVMVLAALALLMAPAAGAQTAGLKLPPYKKLKLKNGVTLILVERHTLPLVTFHAVLNAGAVADPAGLEGAASLTAALLRKGTTTRSAEQFAEQIDFIAGSFNASAGTDSTSVSAEFVKKDLARGLDLYSDAILHPVFPQDEVTKLVKQRLDSLKAARDQAQGVLSTYFNAYLYGKHPYGRPAGGDEKSLSAMTRDAIVKFYETYYTPGNTILVVAGDIDSAQMEKMVTDAFGAWPAKASPAISVPSPAPAQGKRLLLIDKPDSTQTFYRIGNVGIARTNPDRVYIQVVNTLFGGRFTSLLNSELRIKTGLTYGAGSSFDPRKAAGPFAMASYTRNEKTVEAMDLTLDCLKRIHEQGFTEEELTSAKNYIKGQFPPGNVETAGQLANLLATLQFYGLDDSDVNNLYAKIDGMTLADAKHVIQQYFPLDNLVFVVIGKASEIADQVKKYAPRVDALSISDPAGFAAAASMPNSSSR